MNNEHINVAYIKMKFLPFLLLFFLSHQLCSQEVDSETLEIIYQDGKSFTAPLKNGQIESLKNSNPPKDTWTYSKLEEYKDNLNSENIMYGEILMPSEDDKFCSYNLFAYDIKKETYYFVAIGSYKILNGEVKINSSYLFTEKSGLQEWWKSIFGFYQGKLIEKIPEKYLFKTCPPPPVRD